MPSTSDVSRRVRQAVSEAVDPLIAKRAAKLAHHRGLSHRQPVNRRDIEVDRLRAKVIEDLFAASEQGAGTGLDVVDRLVAARLGTLRTSETRTPALVAAVCESFRDLWRPTSHLSRPPEPVITQTISDQFHDLYYHVSKRTWQQSTYAGITTYKCPTDMWIYTELIDAIKPSLIIETGTLYGGSALYLAHALDRLGHGKVITVDIGLRPNLPVHPRIEYVLGSSTAPDILDGIRAELPQDGSPVMVILDSDHRRDHVVAELDAYASMVTPGSYLIVEDTNINGHPALPEWGPGPYEAVEHFFTTPASADFEIDTACERYYLTQNPNGFLRRRPNAAAEA